MFRSEPLTIPEAAASMLANLCCWNQRLPQGAPTSPMISNWICRRLDTQLARLARRNRCVYTRYADDITFSTRRPVLPVEIVKNRVGHDVELGDELLAIITSNWFDVNLRKVWVRSSRECQKVTGIVVNQKVNVTRRYRQSLRAMLHNWEVNGLESAQANYESRYDSRSRTTSPPLAVHAAASSKPIPNQNTEPNPEQT